MEKPPLVTNGVGMTVAGVAMMLISGVGLLFLDQELSVGMFALGLVFIAVGGKQHRSDSKPDAQIRARDPEAHNPSPTQGSATSALHRRTGHSANH